MTKATQQEEAPKKKAPKSGDLHECEVCRQKVPLHVAPDGVPRTADHGECQGQGRRPDGL